MTADAVFEQVRQALADYSPRRIEDPGAMPAAVLILICKRDGEAHVLFTERTDQVEHHKGQVSFPGGARDEDDDGLESTALRETYEEIGVEPDAVEIIGPLDDIVTASNFKVTPYVGILTTSSEYAFVLNTQEVAEIVQAPLAFLMDDRNMELEVRERAGREILTPSFRYDGHHIWGATARILHQFIELLR
ncbi:MAG: CoA pyrophosphatase [Dehalococcoidia bacterium]